MRTLRRIRNVAFLGLVVTLAWAGQVKLSADSGGFYCGYGDCVLTYDNCEGTWDPHFYADPEAGNEPGDCLLIYDVALLPPPGDTCYINAYAEGLYEWPLGADGCLEQSCEGGTCQYCACVQQ